MPEPTLYRSRLKATQAPRAGRLFVASALAFMLIHTGCSATGASAQNSRSASLEHFLSAEKLDSSTVSPRAELIFGQLRLGRALGLNDRQKILDSADSLLASIDGKAPLKSSAFLVDAALWLITHEYEADAAALIRKASARLPEDLPLTALHADLLIQEDHAPEAVELLRAFIVRHPDDAKAQAELALVLLRSGKSNEAMAAFQRIPEKQLTPEIRFAYAQALNTERRFKDAEEQLRKAVEKNNEYAEAWQLLALTLEDQGRYQEAMIIYTRLLGDDPTNRSARLFLLRHHLRENAMDKAVSVVSESAEPLRFAVAASSILMEEKQFEKADKLLDRLEKLPDMPLELNFYHAALLYENGGEAWRMLQLIARVPDDSEEYNKAMRMKVQILCEQKRIPEALEAIETVRILNPEDLEPLLLKAELLSRQKDFENADKALRDALALNPDDERACFQFAQLHEFRGQREEAMRLMEDVLLRFPNNALALNFVGYNLAESGKDLNRALTLVQRALELEPDADFIIDSVAWTFFKLGRHAEAWEYIQKAVEISRKNGNGDPTMLEHFGDIALVQGEKEGARLGYEASLELFLKYNLKDDAERIRIKLKNL